MKWPSSRQRVSSCGSFRNWGTKISRRYPFDYFPKSISYWKQLYSTVRCKELGENARISFSLPHESIHWPAAGHPCFPAVWERWPLAEIYCFAQRHYFCLIGVQKFAFSAQVCLIRLLSLSPQGHHLKKKKKKNQKPLFTAWMAQAASA